MSVRTRVAPSPTGDPHVGTAYMALFNYCFAKKHGGQFLLRIEDTDQVRSSRESEQMILDALGWLGLRWDEGPDIGGPNGPYRQSERSGIYTHWCNELIQAGHAFRCFCTADRIKALRKEQIAAKGSLGYDGHCSGLSANESADRAAAGEPFVIRMKVPRDGTCIVQDQFRGEIAFQWAQIDMQVLMKSDGLPTYHLANVVDDHLMGITHVMRGEEWTTSAPKHLLLYEYFGWQAPKLAHMPLLRNPDKSKLSKRKNPTSILWYQRMGYLPEALLNYLGRMAWSMPNEEEKFSIDEMLANFDLDRISLNGPVFDLGKLDWLNGRWIRENLDEAAFAQRVQDWALNPAYLGQIAPLAQKRVTRLSDLANMVGFFFAGVPEYPTDRLTEGKLGKDVIRQALYVGLGRLDRQRTWSKEMAETTLRTLAEDLGLKLKDVIRPFYVSITGQPSSVPLFDAMALLGRDLVRHRLRHAIVSLGWPTNDERDAWDKLVKDEVVEEEA